MNQHMIFSFSIVKNERLYQIQLQPGAPWTEVEEILEEFKNSFIELKIATEAREKELKEKAAADTQVAS